MCPFGDHSDRPTASTPVQQSDGSIFIAAAADEYVHDEVSCEYHVSYGENRTPDNNA